MNFMGEVVSMVGISAIAGIIIGWCIRNFFGGSDKAARQHFARDINEATKDTELLQHNLKAKDAELHAARNELQQRRHKDDSVDAEARIHASEINELKNLLAASRKALQNNQADFNNFRTETQKEQSELRKDLAKYTNGGVASPERLNDANETIGALRSAVRENDTVIDSLRARVKEADDSVEGLRSQLKTAEAERNTAQNAKLLDDKKIEDLTTKSETASATVEKQKRDYDLMLENKNSDVKSLRSKVDKLTTTSSTLKAREQEIDKEVASLKTQQSNYKNEVVELKRVISDRDRALSKARGQATALTEENKLARIQAQDDSQLKSKSAEVSALNEMLSAASSTRDKLQTDVSSLKKSLNEKDSSIKSIRHEMDDVVARRNKLSSQVGDLQTQGNLALGKLQQDFNSLAGTRDEYKRRIDALQQEVAELRGSKEKFSQLSETSKVREEKLKGETKIWQNEARKLHTTTSDSKRQIENLQQQLTEITQAKDKQLHELHQQLNTTTVSGESKVAQITSDFSNRNVVLQNDLKTLQAKIKEQSHTIDLQKSELTNQLEINKQAATKLAESQQQLTDYRSRLQREESESQRLNHQLSEAESVRLTLTERDAELNKTRIELEDVAVSVKPVQAQLEEQQRQNQSLLNNLQERDKELARLNTQLTDNRLQSKQQQSNISLLTQEKNAQIDMIRSLEQQAENSLQLHTKIAQQSTELESMRARLYERNSSTTSASQHTHNDTSMQAKATTQDKAAVQTTSQFSAQTTTAQSDTRHRTARPETDVEALTGTTSYQTSQSLRFTADGYRIRRPDGNDELTLLEGVTPTVANALNKCGINAFEQIANWGEREVAHYAERAGIQAQHARQYNWPEASKSILNGTYRKKHQETLN